MSEDWIELAPPEKAAKSTAPVRFGLTKYRRNSEARPVILLRREVITALQLENWRVRVRLGRGAHAHQISVVPDRDGPFELAERGTAKGGGTWRLTLPHVATFPNVASMPAERSYKVETEAKRKILTIDLPPFCWEPNAKRRMQERA